MTNNPTIDGVSRELLTNLHKIASRKCKSAWSAGVCDELRALLDALAVERQPIKSASEVAYNLQAENARLEARITQLESEKEFAAATYQAARDRIAELESGLGGMLFAFDDGVGRGWSAKTLDYARKLTPAVEFDATAALNKSP